MKSHCFKRSNLFLGDSKVVKVFFIILASFIISMPALAGTFYVRTDGNDTNSGRENNPSGAWATIQKAADTLLPGDIAEIQSGTYSESVTITNSGTPERYIIFRANGEVIINAKGPSIRLKDANYIRLEGFTCKSTTTLGISLVNSNNNILVRNISSSVNGKGIATDNKSTDNQLIGNAVSQCSLNAYSDNVAVPTSPVSNYLQLPVVVTDTTGSISGNVTLQSRASHQGLIIFKLTVPGESNPFRTYEINTSSDGSYVLTDIPAGIYNLSAKNEVFLKQNRVLVEVFENQTTPNIDFNLIPGDCDNNNVINIFDNSILHGAFGSTPSSPNWDKRADLDNNDVINIFDNSILHGNFGKNGFEPQIIITTPLDGSTTSISSIAVSGTIDDNSSTVTVNGIAATVSNNTFTAPNVPLNEGQNRVSAIATNTMGNKNADLIVVILDTIAPFQPTINTLTSPTNINLQTITGTKSEDTTVITVTCQTATVGDVIYPATTSWSCQLTNLTEGNNDITVIAFDAAGNSSQETLGAITLDTFAPSCPQGVSANADNAKVNLLWIANTEPDLSGYNIYRSTTQGTAYDMVNSTAVIGTAYEDTAVTNGITYYYVITAVDQTGNESTYSDEVSATPSAYPSHLTTIDYSYDDLNRLKSSANGTANTTYTYDEVGNITNKTTEGSVP